MIGDTTPMTPWPRGHTSEKGHPGHGQEATLIIEAIQAMVKGPFQS